MTLPRTGVPATGLPSRILFGMVIFFSAIALPVIAWDREAAERALVSARTCRDELGPDASPDRYLACIRIYQTVYHFDPHYGGSDDAVYEEAQLFEELATRKQSSAEEYANRAAKLYQRLVTQYPTSPRCPDGLLRMGQLYLGPLHDPAAAAEAFDRLRTRYRRSAAAASIPKKSGPSQAPPSTSPAPPPAASTAEESASALELAPGPMPASASPRKGLASVQNIRYWSTRDYTRVIIDIDGEPTYQKTRIVNPERVFFDIQNSRVTSDLINKKFNVSDEFLRQIRVGQNRADTVRVVLDFAAATDCSVIDLHNPFRIVIDVYGARGVIRPPELTSSRPPGPPHEEPPAMNGRPQQAAPTLEPGKPARLPEPKPLPTQVIAPPISPSTGRASLPARADAPTTVLASAPGRKKDSPVPADSEGTSIQKHIDVAAVSPGNSPAKGTSGEASAHSKTPPRPVSAAEGRAADVTAPPVIPAAPTSAGSRTITRMLGLKIGRIVIDPGHGGHDTGTIGRGGLREKDLVLNVALELRKLLEEKMGAEVILTRETDVFIPLEERTAIANQQKADLFVSIHANSASSKNTSGVETYFLNFARTASDREIAARENASSTLNMHELQDLVKKIAQAEKSAESRELAAILQKRLFNGVQQLFPGVKNRGVRSAPFVVLIGANMPSVLAEIAFISNPRDEKLLRRDDSPQRVAKALFSGIEGYTKTLGGEVAQSRSNDN
jgi:N-acetylmuramoyl-L-alanine amidase